MHLSLCRNSRDTQKAFPGKLLQFETLKSNTNPNLNELIQSFQKDEIITSKRERARGRRLRERTRRWVSVRDQERAWDGFVWWIQSSNPRIAPSRHLTLADGERARDRERWREISRWRESLRWREDLRWIEGSWWREGSRSREMEREIERDGKSCVDGRRSCVCGY